MRIAPIRESHTGKQAAKMATAKEEVRRLLESLPDDASLEDVHYSIYVRERIGRNHPDSSDALKYLGN